MSGRVGIIIVSYNQKKYLRLLFETIASQSFNNYQIYFVDNNSIDDSVDHARSIATEFGLNVLFFLLNKNTGYTGGNNYGVKKAVEDGCEYVLILNTDLELDSNCLQNLVECLSSDHSLAVAGPILLFPKKAEQFTEIQEFGADANFLKYKVKKHYTADLYEPIESKIPDKQDVNFITGACFLYRSTVFEQLALFDERYFAYGEEIDLFKRITEAGFRAIVTKHAKVWHHHDWSSRNKKGYYTEYYLIQRNKYLYFKKHQLFRSLVRSLLRDICVFPATVVWFWKICDLKLSVKYLKGTFDGLKNVKGTPVLN